MHFPSQAIRVTAWTTEADKIRMAEIMRRDVSAYVESGGRRKPLTENSTLLRNVRKVFSRRSSARSSVIAAARSVRQSRWSVNQLILVVCCLDETMLVQDGPARFYIDRELFIIILEKSLKLFTTLTIYM